MSTIYEWPDDKALTPRQEKQHDQQPHVCEFLRYLDLTSNGIKYVIDCVWILDMHRRRQRVANQDTNEILDKFAAENETLLNKGIGVIDCVLKDSNARTLSVVYPTPIYRKKKLAFHLRQLESKMLSKHDAKIIVWAYHEMFIDNPNIIVTLDHVAQPQRFEKTTFLSCVHENNCMNCNNTSGSASFTMNPLLEQDTDYFEIRLAFKCDVCRRKLIARPGEFLEIKIFPAFNISAHCFETLFS